MTVNFRLIAPIVAGILGAALYIYSPLSHQAFCSPVLIPVSADAAVAPELP